MKIIQCDQGTEDWYRCRLGIPTASEFERIITPKTWKPSAQQRGYICELVAEKMLNDSKANWKDGGRTASMERGKLDEPRAADEFTFTTGIQLEPVGFVTTDDGCFGCSPDRLVVGANEAVEIKCPEPHVHMEHMLYEVDEYKYGMQVQGQLWVGGFERAHLYSWHRRMPPKHIITEPNIRLLPIMGELLAEFLWKLEVEIARAIEMGPYAAREYQREAMILRSEEVYLQ